VVDARDARRGAAAHLALGLDELGPPLPAALVGGQRTPARALALALVRVPAAGVVRGGAGARVELDELARGLREQRPVVGDEHHAARPLAQQRPEALEAVGVEVVCRLVEQHDVEARRA
jgi:hypothetical protein